MNPFRLALVAGAFIMLVAGCQPGACTNAITGSNNIGNCGGTGDGQDVDQTTPAPVVVPPVVVVPEPAAP